MAPRSLAVSARLRGRGEPGAQRRELMPKDGDGGGVQVVRTRLGFKSQPCGRRSARLIRAATMPGSHGVMMPTAASRFRQVRTVRSDSPV